jgi:prolyl-tRNA synthetase
VAELRDEVSGLVWRGEPVRVLLDDREERPGFKFADLELRGIPLRVDVGRRDLDRQVVTIVRRDDGSKQELGRGEVGGRIPALLDLIQSSLFDEALAFRTEHTSQVSTFDELREVIAAGGGFAVGAWCGDPACEATVKAETKATIRFLPLEPEDPGAPCVVCGRPGVDRATWAIAY